MQSDVALLIIDVQLGILDGPPALARPAALLRTIAVLLADARSANVPVVYVQHDGAPGHRVAVGSPGWPIHADIAPRGGDLVVHKRECDAFYETDLDRELRARGVRRLVVCGAMTQYCIDTSCRRAFSLGYDVTLVSDGHSTADTAHLTAAQIIEHHNSVLDDFGSAAHALRVRPAREVRLTG